MNFKSNNCNYKESGMTLIEVMIAMVLGLFLLAGIFQVFASARMTYRMHENTSRMQETGRMALEVITRDVRMADFWGCASDLSNVVNNLDAGGAGYINFGAGGINGTEGGPGASDTLILRGAVNTGIGLEPPYGPQASAVLHAPQDNGLNQYDIVVVSDCSAGDVFQITDANPSTSGTVGHNTGTGSPGNYNATNPGCPGGGNAHCLSKIYGDDANILIAQEITYNVGVGEEGQPALFRNGLEYLDGVEDLQILYGEDTDPRGSAGWGTANYYVPADQIVDMNSVISIRFAVVTVSYDDNLTGGVAPQNYSVFGVNRVAPDQRMRQVYSSTVTVRNRL